MRLKEIEIAGFKSFAKKSFLSFDTPVTAVVGPNGSGKSNVVEAFRFVLGEQSIKSMRGKSGSDLIFRGSNNTSKLSRASVTITFDNSDKVFSFPISDGLPGSDKSKSPVLFDTITFTREIFADGTSKYLMNGTEIRLKQMSELLSSVNIGSSGHHIISQGEADGILRANHKERREILEDALGLKIYHYRIRETENKLAKSTETLKDVQSLRRELAPHLTFLKKQVEKIEKGQAIRNELQSQLIQYLATEKSELASSAQKSDEAFALIKKKKEELEKRLAALPESSVSIDETLAQRNELKDTIAKIVNDRRLIESRIGRLQGMIEVHRSLISKPKTSSNDQAIVFAPSEYHTLVNDLEHFISILSQAKTIEDVKGALGSVESLLDRMKKQEPKGQDISSDSDSKTNPELKETAMELESLERDLKSIITKEENATSKLKELETQREKVLANSQQSTIERYEIISELKACDSEFQILDVTKQSFSQRKESFDFELKEAGFMFGPNFLHELQKASSIPEINLHDLRRNIDRLKIRLDEHSGIGTEVVNEYESTRQRDEFLSREVIDIENSIKNLEAILIELKKVLDDKFTTGVEIINKRFGEFFKTMFGGGSASLSITSQTKRKKKSDTDIVEDEEMLQEEDSEIEKGIDVHVNLPEKKIKDLQMLSGGERSLVSIALLFAITQVNPPPFLVLDETDAALDEANSRRYGDMVERLSEYSQLIVVTHNRETMSRANVLYGVTLGSDGASKLLSIKFDEAVKVAK